MDAAIDRNQDEGVCRWCGARHKPSAAIFCSNCNGPVRTTGHLLFTFNFIARNLAIPVAIAAVTVLLTDRQQNAARLAADRQTLVTAYVDFAKSHSDYRIALNAITFMASSQAPTVSASDLKEAVLQLDQAFDSVGAKLTPFAEYQKRQRDFVPASEDGKTPLELTWQRCFMDPYYGGLPNAKSYFSEIALQMQQCNDQTCPTQAAKGVELAVEKIDSGKCNAGKPDRARSFNWFWDQLRLVMLEPSKPGNLQNIPAQNPN